MTTQSLADFRAQISADETLQKLLREAQAEGPDSVVKLAAERGFSLQAEEVRAAAESGELSDADMDVVAGGAVSPHNKPPLK